VHTWRGGRVLATMHARAPLADTASSRNGAAVAAVAHDGTAQLWRTGRPVVRIHVPAPGRRVSFDGQGRTLLVAGGSAVRLVDVADGRVIRTLRLPGRVTDAGFGGGSAFAAGTADGRVLAWASRGAKGRTLDAGRTPVAAVAISPDGARVAAASRDGRARIWSIATGKLQHALKRALTPLTDVEFSPDGRFLATGAVGGDVRIWTVANGLLVHVLRGHRGRVAQVTFSPDGEWILTAGPTSVGLWRSGTGRLLLYLRGHRGQVEDASFAPDSKHVVTASADGTVRTYMCPLCASVFELAHLARVRLSHVASELTPRERKRYLGG
jgi:WD40 repeat protein